MPNLRVQMAQADLNRTLRRLTRELPRTVRRATRTAVFRVGSETLRQAKDAAPVGRTGHFKRSLAKKDVRYAAQSTYLSMVGQRKGRRFTARQVASANRKTGSISKGLSGQGKVPPIHFIESGTRPHVIRPKRGRRLWWNVIAGGIQLQTPRTAKSVRHPGHRGTGFLRRTEVRYRAQRIRSVNREIARQLVGLRR